MALISSAAVPNTADSRASSFGAGFEQDQHGLADRLRPSQIGVLLIEYTDCNAGRNIMGQFTRLFLRRKQASVLGALAVGGILAAGPARADSIDGNWCHQDTGLRMSISGPIAVTPGGTRVEGNYGRHDFSYVVPARDQGAGSRIDMRLLGENLVRVTATGGSPEMWDRCGPAVS